jgi:hypothetical protein
MNYQVAEINPKTLTLPKIVYGTEEQLTEVQKNLKSLCLRYRSVAVSCLSSAIAVEIANNIARQRKIEALPVEECKWIRLGSIGGRQSTKGFKPTTSFDGWEQFRKGLLFFFLRSRFNGFEPNSYLFPSSEIKSAPAGCQKPMPRP